MCTFLYIVNIIKSFDLVRSDEIITTNMLYIPDVMKVYSKSFSRVNMDHLSVRA